MASRQTLKTYFETGDKPTEAQFGALIDSVPIWIVKSAATWASENPNLLTGEVGVESDPSQNPKRFKIGDGSAWNSTPYSSDLSYTPVPAFAIDVTKRVNTKSITTNATFTFAGSPTTGQIVGLKLTTDAADRLVTLPEFWCRNRQQLITQVNCYENSTYLFEFEWTGTRWESDSYQLALFDYDNYTLLLGFNIGLNASGTGSVFLGSNIGVGTRQGVPVGAGTRMTTVTDSVFIGFGAAECLISGNGQVAIGRLALGQCLTGQNNTAVGDTSLSRTLGDGNIGIGYQGGTGNINGDNNIFVGHYAGGLDRDKGDFNICIGSYAGNGLLGGNNIFLGNTSGPGNSSGSSTCNHNLGIGFESLSYVTTGDNNIAIGDQSGFAVTTGSGNIFIGDRAGADGQLVSAVNSICLGNNTQSTASNQMVLGHTDITETLLRGSQVRLVGELHSPVATSTAMLSIVVSNAYRGGINSSCEAIVRTAVTNTTAGIGAPRQVYTYESRTLFHNHGATALVYLNLDNTYNAIGAEYEFACTDADGIRFKATSNDYIQDGASQSAIGGYMRSVAVGSVIRIKAIRDGVWFVVSKTGTWTIDS